MRRSCGLSWIFTRRYSGKRERRRGKGDELTWTDGDLWGVKEKIRDGKLTDVRANKLWVLGANDSENRPRGDQKPPNTGIVIQLACLGAQWTTILAELLQTQLLAKSWPWSL